MRISLISILIGLSFFACEKTTEGEPQIEEATHPKATILSDLESAHHYDSWYANELISFDLYLKFRGKERFNGRLLMTPDGGLVKMEDGAKVMIWNGKEAYISPDTISYSKARFDLLTWSYFFAAAYKFSDPGTHISEIQDRPLAGRSYPSFKLTFNDGVGDSPEDWYIIYQDREAKLLDAMAYIVTYSTNKEEAENDPHLITYSNYQNIHSLPIATEWKFWTWNESGEMEELLGEGYIRNLKVEPLSDSLFVAGPSFRVSGK